MVTENVTIRFVEQGARVIKRRVDDIGESANRATRGIFLLQRALFVLGGAGLIRGIVGYADALTNVENRLRLTSESTANLEAVQDRLFASAERSRSSFLATADVYSRVALSARNLGKSQDQVIAVTETLQKAAILSGAGAQEANAALVQLGQGLASDRLSGDELRSVLEQLPLVADILVDYLNDVGTFGTVTRGTLRELGTEGKLTADIVFAAIEASKGGIDELFAQTNITVEQSIGQLRNSFLKLIDDFDDATGASVGLANAIKAVADSLDTLARASVVLAGGFAAFFAASLIGRVLTYSAAITRTGAAVARYNAIQVAATGKQAAAATAVAVDTGARLANIRARQTQIAATLNSAFAEAKEAEFVVVNGRARNLQTGQFVSLTAAKERLTAATVRLNAAEAASQISTSRSTALLAADTAAQNAAAASATRLAAAKTAQASVTSRLAATFPLLTGLVLKASAAFGILGALLLANPFTAAAIAIGAIVAAIFVFGDAIQVGSSRLVSLRDLLVAAFDIMTEAVQRFAGPVLGSIASALSPVLGAIQTFGRSAGEIFLEILAIVIDVFTIIPRVALGVIAGLNAAWSSIPEAAGSAIDVLTDFFASGFEAIANIGVNAINKIIGAINGLVGGLAGTKLGEAFGLKEIKELGKVDLSNLRTNFGGSGKSAGEAFTAGFSGVFEGGKAKNLFGTVYDRALRDAQDRAADANLINIAEEQSINAAGTRVPRDPDEDSGGKKGRGGGGGASDPTFAEQLALLQQQIDLERQFGIQKEINNQILAIEKTIKRELSAVEKDQVANAIQLLEVSKAYGTILAEIKGPQEALQIGQEALNQLFSEGAINLSQYNEQLRNLQINADKAAGTIGGGFRAAIAGSIQSSTEFGEALGGVVVGAAGKAADAIVEFAQTGKLNIRAFFADLFAQLLKLAAQRLLLNLLGSFLGIPPGLEGAGGLLGFSGGGSILPNGPGSTDTQVVQFAKRPDERVDILTPAQQKAQREGGGGSNGTTVVQSPPVNVAAVLSPGDIVGAFNNSDGETVVINILQKNASTVRKLIGG